MGYSGWQCATDVSPFMDEMRFVFHHPGFKLSMYGTMHGYHVMRAVQLSNDYYSPRAAGTAYPIVIQGAASKDMFWLNMTEEHDFSKLKRVDLHSYVVKTTYEEIHNMPFFKELFAPVPEAQELIIDPQCVQSMLDQILKIQGPMRKEIRARENRRESEVRQVHAQIVSLKAA
jgi:hypothetical protein